MTTHLKTNQPEGERTFNLILTNAPNMKIKVDVMPPIMNVDHDIV